MPTSYGLNAYKVDIRTRHARNPWTLRHKSSTDGFSEMRTYLEDRKTLSTIPGTNKALVVRKLHTSTDSLVIDGRISTGEAGAVRNLLDIKNGEPTYTTTKDEAVMAPTYFRFHLEDGRPFGVLIIEPGSTSILEKDILNYFDRLVDPLTVKFRQIVSYEALKKLAKQGALQRVILVNNGGSTASRAELRKTSIGTEKLDGEGDLIELSIKKAGRFSSNTLKRLFSLTKSNSVRSAVKTASMSEFDDIKVEVKMGHRTQRFSMSKPSDTPMRFDITDEVVIGLDGNPKIESLRQAAKRVYHNSIEPVL